MAERKQATKPISCGSCDTIIEAGEWYYWYHSSKVVVCNTCYEVPDPLDELDFNPDTRN